ncbi:unnamed protein product, partial [Ixodes persulcatus]
MAATTRPRTPRAPLLFTKMLKLCMHFTVRVFVGGEARHCHPDGRFYSSVPPFPLLSPQRDSCNSSTPARKPAVVFAFAVVLHLHGADVGVHVSRKYKRILGLGQVRDAGVPHSFFCPAVIAGG